MSVFLPRTTKSTFRRIAGVTDFAVTPSSSESNRQELGLTVDTNYGIYALLAVDTAASAVVGLARCPSSISFR